MKNSTGQSCLTVFFIILFGFIGPLAITIYTLTSDSVTMIGAFFICIIAMICCFIFINEEPLNWIIAGSVSFIYALIFCTWYSEIVLEGNYNDGGLGDLIGMFLMTFTLLLPSCLIGDSIRFKYKKYKKQLNKLNNKNILIEKINNIKKSILELEVENQNIDIKIQRYKTILNLIDLFQRCGQDIVYDNEIKSICDLNNLKKKNKKHIKIKKEELEKL